MLDNINATSEGGKAEKQSAESLAEVSISNSRKHNLTMFKSVKVGKEINNLLKFGAYDLYRDDEGSGAQDMFKEDDVDKILERSSTLIRYDKADGGKNGNLTLCEKQKSKFIFH